MLQQKPFADLPSLGRVMSEFWANTNSLRRRSAPAIYDKLMGDERARAVFTDPPYNVKIGGHVCGSGAIQHREFAMASGEMDATRFAEFLHSALGAMAGVSRDGAIHFVCMDWRHMDELSCSWFKGLFRTEEPDCLGQDQWWHGHVLSLPP